MMNKNTSSANVVAHSAYGPIVVNVNDRVIGRDLLQTGYWARDDIALMQQILQYQLKSRDCITVYDVGANIGTHSLAFSKMFGNRIKVRAFEAQRQVYNMLCGTMALNNVSNTLCHLNAVGDVGNVLIEFAVPDYGADNNFGGLELIAPKRSDNHDMQTSGARESVETVTLDSFNERVDFIKMDIEGMEDKAVRGAAKTIETYRPICFIEVIKTDIESVFSYFRALNYDIVDKGSDAIFLPSELNLRIDGLNKI